MYKTVYSTTTDVPSMTVVAVEWPVAKYDASASAELVTGELAEVTGELAEVTGELAEVTGELAEVTGELAEVTGVLAEVTGVLAEVTGVLAEVTGELAEVRKELASRDAPLAVESAVTEGDTVEVAAPIELRAVATLGSAGTAADSTGVSWAAVCATVAVLPTTVCVVTKPAVFV